MCSLLCCASSVIAGCTTHKQACTLTLTSSSTSARLPSVPIILFSSALPLNTHSKKVPRRMLECFPAPTLGCLFALFKTRGMHVVAGGSSLQQLRLQGPRQRKPRRRPATPMLPLTQQEAPLQTTRQMKVWSYLYVRSCMTHSTLHMFHNSLSLHSQAYLTAAKSLPAW